MIMYGTKTAITLSITPPGERGYTGVATDSAAVYS
jgi:hypothetical protein